MEKGGEELGVERPRRGFWLLSARVYFPLIPTLLNFSASQNFLPLLLFFTLFRSNVFILSYFSLHFFVPMFLYFLTFLLFFTLSR